MVVPFKELAQGVVSLFGTFSDVLNYLNPFSDKFLLSGVIGNLGDVLSYLNPFSDKFLLSGVISNLGSILDYINPFSDNFILKSVIDFLGNLVSYVNPFSDNFLGKKLVEMFSNLFKELFVPTGNQFEELNNKFDEKFGFVNQVKELAFKLFSYNPVSYSSDDSNSDYPSWDITYEGVTVSIIDFSVFDQYRGIVHGIIIGVIYIAWFWRLYRRLPGLIHHTNVIM